jgi:type I restriction enzyme S subunit
MKYASYNEYKPSKISWIHDFPAHWELKRLKYIANRAELKVEADEVNPLPYIGLEQVEPWTGRLFELDGDLVPTGVSNRFAAGDTLFGKLRPYLAKACNVDFDGLCSSELLVLRSKSCERKFLLYQLLSHGFINLVDSSTYGSKMPRASWDFIGICELPLPPLAEQQAIARFLYKKTAQIDALVEKMRQLIDKLKEKRQALIARTVTRGLPSKATNAEDCLGEHEISGRPRPNCDMESDVGMKYATHNEYKPSHIRWIREFPAHWELKRLKYISKINKETLPETTNPDYELLYVDISSVDSTEGIKKKEPFIFESAPSRARRIVQDGDTIVSTVRTYLRAVAYIRQPEKNLIVSTGFVVIRPNRIDPQYLAYSLWSSYFIETVVSLSVGVSYPATNSTVVSCIELPLPPVDEQQAIVRFLDGIIELIDAQEAKIRQLIDRLVEYRQAIITSAVTGKIDVRGLA